MLGLGGAKIPSRPELVEKYGFDVKYASHALRLAIQAREIVIDGQLTLPMREPDRNLVLDVKLGKVNRAGIADMITHYEEEAREGLMVGRTPLPPKPDRKRISAWSIDTHLWQWRRWTE